MQEIKLFCLSQISQILRKCSSTIFISQMPAKASWQISQIGELVSLMSTDDKLVRLQNGLI
ncbi:MAG: hypothetical protein CW336_04990 [Bacteroidetes bacterium]|nr:hypothetical protein [Bacteroidota bacterium]